MPTESPLAAKPENAHLSACYDRVQSAMEQVQSEFGGLSDEQVSWKPDPKSWGVGACLDHLIITYQRYEAPLRDAIERARESATGDEFRPRWFPRVFHRFVDPAQKSRAKAPKRFQPMSDAYDQGVVARFAESHSQLLETIQSADGAELNRVKFASPVTRLIRFSVGEAIWILSSHVARHLQQAQRVVANDTFPK